jgi:hypothetical protein
MKITLDGVRTEMQPTAVRWIEPELLGKSGEGIPLRAPYYECQLSFARVQYPIYTRWREAWNGGEYVASVWLPHPDTGKATEFTNVTIDSLSVNMITEGRRAVASGVDMVISRIVVS